jgi:hypothetical protein
VRVTSVKVVRTLNIKVLVVPVVASCIDLDEHDAAVSRSPTYKDAGGTGYGKTKDCTAARMTATRATRFGRSKAMRSNRLTGGVVAFGLAGMLSMPWAQSRAPAARFNLRVSLRSGVTKEFRVVDANAIAFHPSKVMPNSTLGWQMRIEVPVALHGAKSSGVVKISVPGSAHRETLDFKDMVLGPELILGPVLTKQGETSCSFDWNGPTGSTVTANAAVVLSVTPPQVVTPKLPEPRTVPGSAAFLSGGLHRYSPFTSYRLSPADKSKWNIVYLDDDSLGSLMSVFLLPPGSLEASFSGQWKYSHGSTVGADFRYRCDHV